MTNGERMHAALRRYQKAMANLASGSSSNELNAAVAAQDYEWVEQALAKDRAIRSELEEADAELREASDALRSPDRSAS